MKVSFLGTGTSTGVPQIGCSCGVCTSADPRDRRLRASVLVETDSASLLIDCGPDFREQILALGSPRVDALLVTHSHYDHVGGVDDLRPYCYSLKGFPIFCKHDVAQDLQNRVPYCFLENPYPGIPSFKIHEIDPEQPFTALGVEVTPLPVLHLRLPILGYRIGNFAYVTDCKLMPESTIALIRGVDTLVINSLRRSEHPSHMNLEQTLALLEKIRPGRAFLTHLSHDMGLHAEVDPTLPEGVHIAYDGLALEVP